MVTESKSIHLVMAYRLLAFRVSYRHTCFVFQELSVFCSTIDESWDHDPEARLSAECVEMRLSQLYHSPSVSDVSMSSAAGSSDAKEKVSLVV